MEIKKSSKRKNNQKECIGLNVLFVEQCIDSKQVSESWPFTKSDKTENGVT